MKTRTPAQRVVYVRTENGADSYVLPIRGSGLVHVRLALPQGELFAAPTSLHAHLLSELMPTATGRRTRTSVRDEFDRLGVALSSDVDQHNLLVSLSVRSTVYDEALALLASVLTEPRVSEGEFREARQRLEAELAHEREDTQSLAYAALLRQFYGKAHPHYAQSVDEQLVELKGMTRASLLGFHAESCSAVGALACAVGDLPADALQCATTALLAMLPKTAPSAPRCDPTNVHQPSKKDLSIPLPEKMSVDTLLAIPTTATRTDDDFLALQVGVAILGGSASARLFTELRTKRSLTYGARATLRGHTYGYPAFLMAQAVFPSDVCATGRKALQDVVGDFIAKGITRGELERRKSEITGKYLVGGASTSGLATRLFGTLLAGRTVAYIDEYPALVRALTTAQVNRAIRTHLDASLMVTSASGTIPDRA